MLAGAKVFEWHFGETNSGIDSKDPNPTHTFKSGGKFIVTLKTDLGDNIKSHQIIVTAPPPGPTPIPLPTKQVLQDWLDNIAMGNYNNKTDKPFIQKYFNMGSQTKVIIKQQGVEDQTQNIDYLMNQLSLNSYKVHLENPEYDPETKLYKSLTITLEPK